jgi:dTDP-4-dehydrorhamnose reductase
MRVLVTGANGLVGARLLPLLQQQGHEVLGLGRGANRGSAPYRSCELASSDQVRAAFEAFRPEAIVHTASMTEVDACEKAPRVAFEANVTAAANVAEHARALGAHLVHVSTDYVFDGQAGPYGVDDRPNPRGVYSITKHMGEEAVRAIGERWAIARTAVVYGWPPSARANFGSWLVSTLRDGKQVRLFEDQFVSPSLALNVAQMLAELATRRLEGIWNTCGADVVNRVEFGRALCEEFGFDRALLVPTRLADAGLASPRPPRSGLKVEKTRENLSAQPLGLGESLRRFHREYLESVKQ